ncbi:hypothetical protein [Streptococcus himalayensis]|uniref:Uncharacterized protein n=1 Tax=Streptococcus himalayensis TaxID=1888195 RepID=A0A917A4L4_9STRE|nr:hypothetical protein [Streptococcus himalayensis]QBX16544.1 hypothetical protein Javan255_0029 [Streptococcus phage Javan255]GGE27021.1 hypothetical protein GCM10011510_05250 [Streptococcus himalayensis]
MYETREQAFEGIQIETKAVIRYSKATQKAAREGRQGHAWAMADIAKMALQCMRQAHEELWEFCKGQPTPEEMEKLVEAEEAEQTFKKSVASLG